MCLNSKLCSGKEHALVICNHRSDIDWLIGWVIAQVLFKGNPSDLHQLIAMLFLIPSVLLRLVQRAGCLGSALAIMKKSAKFLPVSSDLVILSLFLGEKHASFFSNFS